MNSTIMGTALCTIGGIALGLLLGKHMAAANTQKWRARMESKQIDTDIRLDLLEYNQLHEDGNLKIYIGD